MPELKGPLGIWNFPILNLIREFIKTQKRGFKEQTTERLQKSDSPKVVTRNLEKWEWISRRGEKRELIVHREVEE